jgi:putative ABC transport system permease protein
MGNGWRDVRYGLRMLSKSKGFTAVAILALALGIGPNVAMFSVIWAAFLAPNPSPEPKQLVVVWTKIKGERRSSRASDFVQYRDQSKSFQRLDFLPWVAAHLNGSDPSEEPVTGNFITPGFLSKNVRENMFMGRDFLPQEGIPGNDHVVIVSHRLWQERFHADPNILGKQVRIEDQPYTVVGVRPKGPADRGDTQFIVPFALAPGGQDTHWGNIFGRLKPGVSLAQAQAELAVIDRQLSATRGNEESKDAWTVGVEEMQGDWFDKKVARNLWLLLASVGFVLLIACANVANLLLARGTARQQEIAIRSALGASRRQVFTQLLVESLTLAILGGAIGVALGWGLLQLVVGLMPNWVLQMSEEIQLNPPVLIFATAVTLLGGVLFGIAPAWRAAKLNLSETLSQGSQSVIGGRRMRTQALLVVGEFALAITLLAGAGMAMHSFWKLTSIDLGFRADHVLITGLHKRNTEHPTADQINANARQLLEKLRSLPGVENVSLSTSLPLEESNSFRFSIAGQPVSAANRPVADLQSVTPSYFDTFGVLLLKGRLLSDSDTPNNPQAVMVSESFVRRYLGSVDPLDQRLLLPQIVPNQELGPPIEHQIVGVFRDVANGEHRTDQTQPEILLPFWQNPWYDTGLAVKTVSDPSLVAKSVRAAVLTTEPTVLIDHISTMESRVNDQISGDRLAMALFGGFAALALVLAALGIYGVMAFAVGQRRHEIGLRMALGAQRHQVVTLILADGMKLALLGTGIGLVGAYLLGRLMSSTLYGVNTVDVTSLSAVAFMLLAAAVIASYLPARHSARIDPMIALRQQ